MQKIPFLYAGVLFLLFSCKQSPPQGMPAIHPAPATADTLQYYFYGIAILNPNIAQELLEKYQVRIVNTSCILDTMQTNNNEAVEQTILKKQGVSIIGYIRQRMKDL